MRSIIKICLRPLHKWSGLWPTPVFWSQHFDLAVKTIHNCRVKDLHSVISWEATRSAETCAFVLTLPPMRSLTGTTLWRRLRWIPHIPWCSTFGFSSGLSPRHPIYCPSTPRDKQETWSQSQIFSDWQPREFISAVEIALHKVQGHRIGKIIHKTTNPSTWLLVFV